MPTTTPELSLYKYNTDTDGNMTYNITNSMNNNWDKIDTYCGNLSSNKADKTTVNAALDLKADTSTVNTALALKADKTVIHALKGYSDGGELLTDAEGLADVKKYAHSTFDLSKFTITGSTVSADGIATDFSGSNRVTTTFNYNGSDLAISVGFVFTSNINSNGANIFQLRPSNNSSVFRCYMGASYSLILFSVTGENLTFYPPDGFVPYENDFIIVNAILNKNNTVTFKVVNVTQNKTFTKTTTGTITNAPSSTDNKLYIGNANGNEYYLGAIDLKYTSVYNNGVPVFSGNITGIDTIKPDDYTVQGTVTISNDGVASGFGDTNNYIKTSIFAPNGKPWKIYRGFTTSTIGTTQRIYSSKQKQGLNLLINSNNHFVLQLSSDGSSINIGSIEGSYTVLANTKYVLCAEFTGSEYRLSYSVDGGKTFNSDGTPIASSTSVIDATANGVIGTNTWFTNTQFKGSIDLNTCIDYVDGDLVYQPCLKIPYTQSKTGSKIADSVYRPRVNDMYGQFGYAPYYTLSDTDFTLPQGELYGMIPTWTNVAPEVKSYGITSVGSLTNSNGVLSGFSGSNYALINNILYAENNSWEINVKVTTDSTPSTHQGILSDTANKLELELFNGKWSIEINGGTVQAGTYSVQADTTYYLRLKYNNFTYTLEYSTDGTNYTTDITYSSAPVYSGSGSIYLGLDLHGGTYYWNGSIDLNSCNIKVDNSIIWEGIKTKDNTYPTLKNPAVVVESYIKGNSWYRVWSDGWCEQGGYLATTSSSVIEYTIEFLKPFINRDYFFNRSPHWAITTSNALASIYDNGYYTKTESSISFRMHENNIQRGTNWYACGYIK